MQIVKQKGKRKTSNLEKQVVKSVRIIHKFQRRH